MKILKITNRKHYLLLALTLILALALRLLLLGHKPFWADEGSIWWMAAGEVKYQAPRIYYDAFNWSIQLFGWNEFAGRFPAVLYGTISVQLVYLICRNVWGKRVALMGCLLAAVSPYLVAVSQEMRHYSLAGMLLLAAIWCIANILKTQRFSPYWWAGLLIISLLGQFAYCFFIFFLGCAYLTFLAYFGLRQWRRWLPLMLVTLATLLIQIHLVLSTLSLAGTRPSIYAANLPAYRDNVYHLGLSLYCFLFGNYIIRYPDDISADLLSNPGWLAIASLLALVWVIAVIVAFQGVCHGWKQNDNTKPVLGLLLISGLFYAALFTVINVNTPVHLIFVFIPFLLLLSAGLFSRRSRLVTIVFCALLLSSGIALIDHYSRPTSAYDQTDWKAAGQYLSEHQHPHDAVLFLRARDAYYALKFYDRNLPEQVYYRPRHEPDSLSGHLPRTWWNSRTLDEQVAELSAQHAKLWVIETIGGWAPQDSLDMQTKQIGKYLQLHLVSQ